MALPAVQSFAGIAGGQGLEAFSANWDVTSGGFQGSTDTPGNLAPNGTDSTARWVADAFNSGHRSSVTYPAGQASYVPFIGPMCRVDASGNGYGAIWSVNSGTIFLNNYAAGGFSASFGADITGQDCLGKTLELTFFPNNSRCFIVRLDGVILRTALAAGGLRSNGAAGLAGFSNGPGTYASAWGGDGFVLPTQAAASFSVDFTALPDGALGAPNWTQIFPANGNIGVSGAQLLPSGLNSEQGARLSGVALEGNQWARITVVGTPGDNKFWDAGVCWAGAGATNRGYRFGGDDTEWFLQRLDANVFTQLRQGAWTLNSGDVIECWRYDDGVNPPYILGLQNGVVMAYAEDSTYSDGAAMCESSLAGALNFGGTLFEAGNFEADTVEVPDVVGQSQASATTEIEGADLVVGDVTTAYSPTVPAGDVISQSPVAGTEVAPGSEVDLVVSLGPEPVEVPDVVGFTQADATALLEADGFQVTVVLVADSTVEAGVVISQVPAGGASAPAGSTVTITVSTGAESVLAPEFLGYPNVRVRGLRREKPEEKPEPLPADITNMPDAPPPPRPLAGGFTDALGGVPDIVLPDVEEAPKVQVPAVVVKAAEAPAAPAVAPAPPAAPAEQQIAGEFITRALEPLLKAIEQHTSATAAQAKAVTEQVTAVNGLLKDLIEQLVLTEERITKILEREALNRRRRDEIRSRSDTP